MQVYNLHAHKKKPNVEVRNMFAPVPPFQLCAVGGTGRGKTNAMLSMLISAISFDRYYIYSKHLDDPNDVYDILFNYLNKTEQALKKKLKDPDYQMVWWGNTYDEIPSVDEYDGNYKSVLLVDDFMNEMDKNSKKLKDIFISGKHKNVSVIFLVQRYNEIPPTIRSNTNYYCLFEMNDRLEDMLIAREQSLGISYEEFLRIYHEAVKERYSFFVIDKKTDYPMLKYRKKWDGVFNE